MTEWISVKDRLPESNRELVLVHYHQGYGLAKYEVSTCCWHIRPFYGDDDWYASKDCVTHWMPLPESPQAKSWATCIGDARDGTTISITIDVSDSNLPLPEFESRAHRIFERAMTGIKREWGDDG